MRMLTEAAANGIVEELQVPMTVLNGQLQSFKTPE